VTLIQGPAEFNHDSIPRFDTTTLADDDGSREYKCNHAASEFRTPSRHLSFDLVQPDLDQKLAPQNAATFRHDTRLGRRPGVGHADAAHPKAVKGMTMVTVRPSASTKCKSRTSQGWLCTSLCTRRHRGCRFSRSATAFRPIASGSPLMLTAPSLPHEVKRHVRADRCRDGRREPD